MIQLLNAIPATVLYGCVALIVFAAVAAIALFLQSRSLRVRLDRLTGVLRSIGPVDRTVHKEGLPLPDLERLRGQSKALGEFPAHWWWRIESYVEQYTSPSGLEGYFLTEQPRNVLSYEFVVGRHIHFAFFGAVPGLLTGAGLTLTFVAILLALAGVHYDRSNTVEPISGIDTLINGLSGKFLSSIIALLLSLAFTLYEKKVVRGLRNRYELLVGTMANTIPHLSMSRILLDIQRLAVSSRSQRPSSVPNIVRFRPGYRVYGRSK